MNKQRREALGEIRGKLEDTKSDIEMLRDEEQEYIDNMPESLQSSERCETAENAVSNMDEAINGLEDIISNIDDATA